MDSGTLIAVGLNDAIAVLDASTGEEVARYAAPGDQARIGGDRIYIVPDEEPVWISETDLRGSGWRGTAFGVFTGTRFARTQGDWKGRTVEPRNFKGVLAEDGRRAVWIEGGDLWRGELDVSTGELVTPRRLTDVGVLGNEQVFLWSGPHVFFVGNFDAARPVVRVDTVTGELVELDWFGTGDEGGAQIPHDVNPTGSVAVYHEAAQATLHLIDLTDGSRVRVDCQWPAAWPYHGESYQSHNQLFGRGLHGDARVWVDGSRLATFAEPPSAVSVLDVSTATLSIVAVDPSGEPDAHPYSVERPVVTPVRGVPGVAFVEQGYRWRGKNRESFQGERSVLLDVPAGVATHAEPLPGAVWLTPTRAVVVEESAGLSGNGVYLHDTETGSRRKICRYTGLGQMTLLPSGDHLVFTAEAGGRTMLMCADMADDGEARVLVEEFGNGWAPLVPAPDRLTLTGDALWDVPAPAPMLPDQAGAPSEGSSPLAGVQKIEEEFASESDDVRRFALACFQRICEEPGLRFIDPVAGTRVWVAAYKADPKRSDDSRLLSLDLSKSLDRERIRAHVDQSVRGNNQAPEGYDEAQISAMVDCMTSHLHDYASKDASACRGLHSSGFVNVYTHALTRCQGQTQAAQQTQPAKTQPQERPNDVVDDAIDETTDKVKGKLKKLFGGG